jgi:hypothetical protein
MKWKPMKTIHVPLCCRYLVQRASRSDAIRSGERMRGYLTVHEPDQVSANTFRAATGVEARTGLRSRVASAAVGPVVGASSAVVRTPRRPSRRVRTPHIQAHSSCAFISCIDVLAFSRV